MLPFLFKQPKMITCTLRRIFFLVVFHDKTVFWNLLVWFNGAEMDRSVGWMLSMTLYHVTLLTLHQFTFFKSKLTIFGVLIWTIVDLLGLKFTHEINDDQRWNFCFTDF